MSLLIGVILSKTLTQALGFAIVRKARNVFEREAIGLRAAQDLGL